jgi:hypothetical protein
VYGHPSAQFGQGQLARVEIFVDSEKSGKLQRVYLEGNVDPPSEIPYVCGEMSPK